MSFKPRSPNRLRTVMLTLMAAVAALWALPSAAKTPVAALAAVAVDTLADSTADCLFSGSDDHSLTLFTVQDLNFGGIFTSPTAGTVTVSPLPNSTPVATYSSGVSYNARGTNAPPRPAMLHLTIYNSSHCSTDDHCTSDDNECDRGEDDDNKTNDDRTTFTRHGANIALSISNSSMLYLQGNTSVRMTADNFTMRRTEGNISVGATLHVGANQTSGRYTGTFTVTAVYE